MKGCFLLGLGLLLPAAAACAGNDSKRVTVRPAEFGGAIQNPLKGFRPDSYTGKPFCTVYRRYVPWSDIEKCEGDSAERIIAYTNRIARHGGKSFADLNVKLVPRVYLDWDGTLDAQGRPRQFWPEDLHTFDYESPEFQRRLLRLVEKMGQAWDEDPRIYAVQMGLIGYWGEHHSPEMTPEQRRALTDAFRRAFPHKPVLVRIPEPEFAAAGFGVYYDTFGFIGREPKPGQTWGGEVPVYLAHQHPDLWKGAPVEGEVEYNWQKGRAEAKPEETFGRTPDETMTTPAYRRYMVDKIRRYHASYLGWIADFDGSRPEVVEGAGELMKAFGYRFVVEELSYTPEARPGGTVAVRFTVRNDGSAPLYLDWPVAVALLDPGTRRPVWQAPLKTVDVRRWLPGEKWNADAFAYDVPPARHQVAEEVMLPADLRPGTYVLALAILDQQGGMLPSARFAVTNYWKGGWHPFGHVGVGSAPPRTQVDPATFDSPAFDDTLHYRVPGKLLAVQEPPVPAFTPVAQWKLDFTGEIIDPWRSWQLASRGKRTERHATFDGPVEGPAGRKVITVDGDFGPYTSLHYTPFNNAKLPPGKYRFSCRVKGTPGQTARFQVVDNWAPCAGDTPLPLSAEWRKHVVEFEIRGEFKGVSRLRFLMPANTEGEFSVSDLHLRKPQ